MAEYDETTYGDRLADQYDELPHVKQQPTDDAVALLAELAGKGPVLELAVGTGRIALPLVRRGIEVHGIDASSRMVAKLRAKPGGDRIPVTMGNFADVAVSATYSLIFVVFNTFFALLSQDEQVRCLRNVRPRLAPGGAFLLEVFFPNVDLLAARQKIGIPEVDADQVFLDATRFDLVTQRATAQHIFLSNEGIRMYPVQIRYAWPSEIDLMAQLAGLRLRERWGGWHREPFTEGSGKHISVYEPAG